jgi:hypothetical protein
MFVAWVEEKATFPALLNTALGLRLPGSSSASSWLFVRHRADFLSFIVMS